MSVRIGGRYEVLSRIREGGMGTVYRVRRLPAGELRVVKVMRRQILDDEDARKRFFREARLARALRHPNIAALEEFAEDDEHGLYMVLEYVDGPNLTELAAALGSLPVETVLDIGLQTLSALGEVHANGIVHRDVSPENLLLTLGEDGRLRVKLIDLGVAKDTGAEEKTQTGLFLGKLRYASPEQLGSLPKGEPIDGRSDLYALGCVLYHLLTGEDPYPVETANAYAMHHLMKPPRPFAQTDPIGRVPEPLRDLVLRALEKKRENRFPDAAAMAEELLRIGNAVHGETFPTTPAPVRDAILRFRELRDEEADRSRIAGTLASQASVREEEIPTHLVERRPAPPPKRSSLPLTLGVLGAGFFLVVLLTAALVLSKRKGNDAPPVPGTLLLTAAPWGRVVEVRPEAGGAGLVLPQETFTPVRLELPAGRWVVRLETAVAGAAVEATGRCAVAPGGETPLHVSFPGFDLEGAVRSLVP